MVLTAARRLTAARVSAFFPAGSTACSTIDACETEIWIRANFEAPKLAIVSVHDEPRFPAPIRNAQAKIAIVAEAVRIEIVNLTGWGRGERLHPLCGEPNVGHFR